MKKPLSRSRKERESLPLAKLLKLFQLVAILKAGRWTIKQLVERFDSSKSSMYRYLELLEEAGFYIDKDQHDRHFIVTTEDDPLESQFTMEEMAYVRTLVQGSARNPFTASVLKKLSLHSEMDSMPRLFLKAHLGMLVEQLNNAMRAGHQVILRNYHSANSEDIRDRMVDPIHFDDSYVTINALDHEDQVCKQFKLDRISEVVETHKPFKYKPLHIYRKCDIFGFGVEHEPSHWITLKLSLRAWLLMCEEYPLAVPYLKEQNNERIFHGPVATYQGIGRFVMGLLDEIRIVGPEEFREYVKEKVKVV